MLDVEKFLIALRSNKDLDGKLKPIFLADTVQEEIKITQAAVENSRREWVGLTDEESVSLLVKANKPKVKGQQFTTAPEMAAEFGRLVSELLKERNT